MQNTLTDPTTGPERRKALTDEEREKALQELKRLNGNCENAFSRLGHYKKGAKQFQRLGLDQGKDGYRHLCATCARAFNELRIYKRANSLESWESADIELMESYLMQCGISPKDAKSEVNLIMRERTEMLMDEVITARNANVRPDANAAVTAISENVRDKVL